MRDSCTTKLLTDEPSETDELGGHKAIAEALVQTVAESDGGKAIAVIGSYGSGKSTVVKLFEGLLAQRLGSHSNTSHVFVFDAWSHQGDPLRRSFLEELRSSLITADWLAADALEMRFDALSSRRQHVVTTSSPVLTTGGNLVALSAFLLPLGIALFSHAFGTIQNKPSINTQLLRLGLLLTLMPFIVAGVCWLFDRPRNVPIWNCDFWTSSRSDPGHSPIVELLWRKTRDITNSESLSTPEPTSVEFRSLFRDAVKAALFNPARRLVIVLDNLDRLDPNEATTIFATMRAFFDQTHKQEKWESQLWLMVPFEPTWARRVVETSGSVVRSDVTSDSTATSERMPTKDTDVRSNGIGPASLTFLEKSFQVQIYVPQPVLSHWKQFFLTQLAKTLPGHSKDYEQILFLYGYQASTTPDTIAPRRIKQFLNRLATLHILWHHRIPIVTQAAFVLYGSDAIHFVERTISSTIIPAQVIPSLDDPNWKKHFAAMYFNVEPAEANQVLLGVPITQALINGDTNSLSSMVNEPGFSDVCQEIFRHEGPGWAHNAPPRLCAAVATLAAACASDTLAAVRDQLRYAAGLVEKWPLTSPTDGQGLSQIIAAFPEQDQLQRISAVLEKTDLPEYNAAVPVGESLDKYRRWVEAVEPLLRWSQERFGNALPSHVTVPYTPGQYVELMAAIEDNEGTMPLAYLFRPSHGKAEILDLLASAVEKDPDANRISDVLDWLLQLDFDWPLPSLTNRLGSNLATIETVMSERVIDAQVRTLLLLALKLNEEAASAKLRELLSNSALLHRFAVAGINSSAASAILFTILLFSGEQPGHGESANAVGLLTTLRSNPTQAQYSNLLDGVTRLFATYGDLAEAISTTKSNSNNSPLLAVVVPALGKMVGYGSDKFLDPFMADYDYLREIIPASAFNEMLKGVTEVPGAEEKVVTGRPFSVSDTGFYRSFLDVDGRTPSYKFLDFLVQGSKTVGKDDWLAQLRSEGPLVGLTIALRRENKIGWLQGPFHDALRGHASMLASEEISTQTYGHDWQLLLEALEWNLRKTLMRYIRDDLDSSDPVGTMRVIRLYEALFEKQSILEEEPDRTVRLLLSTFVEKRHVEGILWATTFVAQHREVLRKAYSETKEALAGRLDEVLADSSAGDELRSAADVFRNEIISAIT